MNTESATDRLTPRQEKFCIAYAKLGVGAKAAREAGYSEGAAKQTACALLAREAVSNRVKELRAQYAIEELAALSLTDRQREALAVAADRAITVLLTTLDATATSPELRVKIAISILDRAGHAPRPESDSKEQIIGGLPE